MISQSINDEKVLNIIIKVNNNIQKMIDDENLNK